MSREDWVSDLSWALMEEARSSLPVAGLRSPHAPCLQAEAGTQRQTGCGRDGTTAFRELHGSGSVR